MCSVHKLGWRVCKAPLTLRNVREQKECVLRRRPCREEGMGVGAEVGSGPSAGLGEPVGEASLDLLGPCRLGSCRQLFPGLCSSHKLPSAGTSEYHTPWRRAWTNTGTSQESGSQGLPPRHTLAVLATGTGSSLPFAGGFNPAQRRLAGARKALQLATSWSLLCSLGFGTACRAWGS